MEHLIAVATYTIRQHVRHKMYLAVGLFGVILLGGAVVVSALSPEDPLRLILDIGLAGIEFLALLSVVFVTVNLVIEEIESRTIYVLLAHPISRSSYIVGRFLGTLAAVGAGMMAMAALHVGVLVLEGWQPSGAYAVAVVCAFSKIAVVGAVALLLSLISTSAASSMTSTLSLWMLGHFLEELSFIAQKTGNPVLKPVLWVICWAVPNFSYFNFRDFLGAVRPPTAAWFFWMAGYAVCYSAACVYASCWLFADKEL